MPRQEVIVDIGLVRAGAAILVFLDAKGIGDDSGAGTVGEAAQHSLAARIVEVLFLVSAAGKPLREMIQQVVSQRAGGTTESTAGRIAEGVVAAGVALPAMAGAD